MTRLLHRPQRDERPLLDACTTAHQAPAAHLTGDHSNRPIAFDDMDVFDGMPPDWQPGRTHDRLGNGYGSRVMGFLRAAEQPTALLDALNARPIPHANWDAWLADDWDHINSRWDNLADALGREFARWHASAAFAPTVATAPILAELLDLTAVQLPELRKARAALLAELKPCDTESEA